jgi:hypothetical protein
MRIMLWLKSSSLTLYSRRFPWMKEWQGSGLAVAHLGGDTGILGAICKGPAEDVFRLHIRYG